MIRELHRREHDAEIFDEFSEGERTLLCSNKECIRSPSLDLGIHPNSSKEELLSVLANIIVEAFLWQYEHRIQNDKKSGNILPGINQGTS